MRHGYRGRVMALYGVTMDIGGLIGAFLIGQIANLVGISISLTLCVLAAMAVWLWLRERLPEAAGQHPSQE